MFAWLNQIVQVSWMNLKNIPQRTGTSLVIVVGIAGVVGVLTAILSMGAGFRATLGKAGYEDRAIVMRSGATSELSSGVSREQVDVIRGAPGIRRTADGKPIVTAELLVIADLPKASTGTLANAAVRGVQPDAFLLRPEVKITAGRMFNFGTREVIVGKQAASQFAGLKLGSRIAFRDSDWVVVGIFEADGSVNESELWADAEVVQNTFRRNGFQSVSVALEDKSALSTFKDALTADPRLQVKVSTMKQYFASQSESMSKLINVLGYAVGLIMAVGAVFGALNTMYAAISTRGREIATLRAIGFGAMPIVISVLLEAQLLALVGGAIGAIAAYLMFNGYTAATLGSNFSQVAFDFRVTPTLMEQGIVLALMIGLVGGVLPAWRAARLPVATALRAE
jgi:putative ABC transport system permease protein